MTRGPAPRPTYLRLLAGNPSKRPFNTLEPQPEKGSVDPPDWLVDLDVPRGDLQRMTVEQLRELGRDVGAELKSRMTKDEVIEAIAYASEGDRLRFWRRIQNDLVRMNVMTKADGHALALLCDSLGRYVECQRLLRDEGLTYDFVTKAGVEMPMQRPEVGIASNAMSQAMRLMDRFGLNPAYRTKLKVEAEEEESALEKLRARGNDSAS